MSRKRTRVGLRYDLRLIISEDVQISCALPR